MSKKMNKVAKATLATALVTSAIVPVASVSASAAGTLDGVIITKDGKQIEVSRTLYNQMLSAKIVSASEVTHIKVGDKYFTKTTYNQALSAGKSAAAALDLLVSRTDIPTASITPEVGKIVNGELVGDSTPEEN